MAASTKRARGNVLTWPFHEEHWLGSLWIPLLWWIFIPPIVFPIGTVPAIGWLLDATARRGRQDARLLPESRDLPRMIKYGLIFAGVWLLYFVIPPLVFSAAVLLNEQYANERLSGVMAQSIQWGYGFIGHVIFGTPSEDFSTISNQYARLVREEEITTLLSTLVAGLYIVLIVPLFVAGTVRFALTGKARSFFHILVNLGLFLTHLGGFFEILLPQLCDHRRTRVVGRRVCGQRDHSASVDRFQLLDHGLSGWQPRAWNLAEQRKDSSGGGGFGAKSGCARCAVRGAPNRRDGASEGEFRITEQDAIVQPDAWSAAGQ